MSYSFQRQLKTQNSKGNSAYTVDHSFLEASALLAAMIPCPTESPTPLTASAPFPAQNYLRLSHTAGVLSSATFHSIKYSDQPSGLPVSEGFPETQTFSAKTKAYITIYSLWSISLIP